jgi:hypothetical protein
VTVTEYVVPLTRPLIVSETCCPDDPGLDQAPVMGAAPPLAVKSTWLMLEACDAGRVKLSVIFVSPGEELRSLIADGAPTAGTDGADGALAVDVWPSALMASSV